MDTVQATPKSTTMKYNRSTIEQEDKEIEELEASRKGVEEEVEILNPEESTFKKRYGDLRRHQQRTQEQHTEELRKC